MSDRTVTNGRRPGGGYIMTCRVSLWVCMFVCYDAVKSSRQRQQSGGGVDVWLSVNTVIIIILYITVRLQLLLTRHTTSTTNSNKHGVVVSTATLPRKENLLWAPVHFVCKYIIRWWLYWSVGGRWVIYIYETSWVELTAEICQCQ